MISTACGNSVNIQTAYLSQNQTDLCFTHFDAILLFTILIPEFNKSLDNTFSSLCIQRYKKYSNKKDIIGVF